MPVLPHPPQTGGEETPARGGGIALATRDLRCTYGGRRLTVVAVDRVSFDVAAGRALGVAGESGSGKSTMLRAIAGLLRPAAGRIELRGAALAPTVARRSRGELGAIQIVFQNPDSTLNPRQTVGAALGRPLRLFRPDVPADARRAAMAETLARVELPARLLDRLPWELSAGQRQRVAIARALIARPQVLLCDEITSALDVSAQAAVLELLHVLRREEQLALVFVTHDLGVLRHVADEVLVLERGVVREQGPVLDVLWRPSHPYTSELIAAVPDPRARVA